MMTGSCLCGEVVYQLNNEIKTIVYCHCSRCRKQTGSAFNAATAINKEDLTFIKVEEKIKVFSCSGVNRHFCGQCGSHLFSSRDNDNNSYRLRIGLINEPINAEKRIHIYTGSKANWDIICDGYPEFEEGIPPK